MALHLRSDKGTRHLSCAEKVSCICAGVQEGRVSEGRTRVAAALATATVWQQGQSRNSSGPLSTPSAYPGSSPLLTLVGLIHLTATRP